MDLEEIFNIDPVVLEQLLEQPLQEEEPQEEPPQHNLVDVDSQTIAYQSWGVVRQLFRLREGILQPRPYERPKRKDKTMDRKQEELLRLFEPFLRQDFQATLSKYDNEKETGEQNGRRYVRWQYSRSLNRSVVPRAMANIEERVKVAYYLRYSTYILLYSSEEKMYIQEF